MQLLGVPGSLIVTTITLTERGRPTRTAPLHDCGDAFLWPILEMCFPKARTITRSNEGWSVDLDAGPTIPEP